MRWKKAIWAGCIPASCAAGASRGSWSSFFDFAPEVRKVVYTTNMIESINSELRRSTRNRGHFPSDEALIKVLYLRCKDLGRTAAAEATSAGAATSGRQHSTSSTSCSQAARTGLTK